MAPAHRRWEDIALPPSRAKAAPLIAVLPLGAHEQHGPHLPPETDTIIVNGIVESVIAALPPTLPVTFLPTETIGYSVEHIGLGDTQSLTWDEAIGRWIGIAETLHGHGVRKFVMLNAHGGNAPLMTIVATEARIRFGMLAVATSWTRFGLPPDTIDPREKAFGIHAGEIETSVMLALDPGRVDMAKADLFPSFQEELDRAAGFLRAYGPHAFGWTMRDLNPVGAAGNARAATAEKGRRLIAHSTAGLVGLLEDVDAFDIRHFD